MSTKILGSGEQPSATPVAWRTVCQPAGPATRDVRRRGADSEQEEARRIESLRQEAFAEGVQAGRAEAEEQIRPAIEGLAHTMQELAGLRQAVRAETLRDLVHLAVTIASRVIHREVAVDSDALEGLVQGAFLKLQAREIHKARMHPDLERLVKKCLAKSGAPANLVLVADPALRPGELFFETAQGELDVSVETQLREIERGLIDKLDH